MTLMLTAESRSRDFPSLGGMAYLNTAAEGIPPAPVLEALAQYGRDKLLGMDGRKLHEEQWRGVRRGAGELLGLNAERIGICSCSSEAFNLAALSLRLREGDEIIVNDLDFPAGATPWLLADCPATVRVWRSRDGALHVGDLIRLLGARTRLVSTSLVSFYNGHMVCLAEIIGAVRAHSDAMVAVDVTQALGRIPLDMSGADLVISSTHKWILGTHGGGLVGLGAENEHRWSVPAGGWFNISNAFDADRFDRVVIKPGAAGFSVGMPNYPAVYAVNAALRYISSVGVGAINDHARPLVLACLDGVGRLPVQLLTPNDPEHLAGIIAFRHERAERIHQMLHDARIHVMHHAGRLRVSIHGYNTADDVEAFLGRLHEAIRVS